MGLLYHPLTAEGNCFYSYGIRNQGLFIYNYYMQHFKCPERAVANDVAGCQSRGEIAMVLS